MAKGVTLKSVRVLDCFNIATAAAVIAAIDAVTAHHTAGQPAASFSRRATNR